MEGVSSFYLTCQDAKGMTVYICYKKKKKVRTGTSFVLWTFHKTAVIHEFFLKCMIGINT